MENFAKYVDATFTFTSGTLPSGNTLVKRYRYADQLQGELKEIIGNGWVNIELTNGAHRFVLKENLVRIDTALVDPTV